MERDVYRIVRSAAGWALYLNGQSVGTFETQDTAERAARAAARLSRRRGRLVEITTDVGSNEKSPRCSNGCS